ncbi:hypothetical protein OQA88_8628 [Cercophora sp. LCS_1]
MAYPYQPLNLPFESRILTIPPPDDVEGPLIGSLTTLPLTQPEPYDALSYSWSRSKNITKTTHLDQVMTIGVSDPNPDSPGGAILSVREILNHEYYGQFWFEMGGVLPPGTIAIDGVTININGELVRALMMLRSRLCQGEEPLRLWVDALCINQSDIAERNEHVRMMGQIYQKAAHVRVWLGFNDRYLSPFVQTMHDIVEIANEGIPIPEDGPYPSSSEIESLFEKHPKSKTLDWDSVAEFFNRAWFHRTWVVQEAAFARELTLYADSYSFTWKWFLDVILFLRRNRLDTPVADHKGLKATCIIDTLRTVIVAQGKPYSHWGLLTLLEELRGLDSTLAADKIYGVLSLTDPRDNINLVVDYSKSPEKIFTDYAASLLNTNSLDILSHCVLPSKSSSLSLPSWVPDWTRPGFTEPFRVRDLLSKASGGSKPSFHITNNVLRIKGRLLDRITEIDTVKIIPSPAATYDKGYGSSNDPKTTTLQERNEARETVYWDNIKSHVLNMEKIALSDGGCIHALARATMCNRTRTNEKPHWTCVDGLGVLLSVWKGEMSSSQAVAGKARYMIQVMGEPEERYKEFCDEVEVGLDQLSGSFSKWTHNRRFFKAESGRLGWGVDGILEGDVVVVLYGGDYLFVLREVEAGRHVIVGDAWLDGFGDGEGMEERFEGCEKEFVIV